MSTGVCSGEHSYFRDTVLHCCDSAGVHDWKSVGFLSGWLSRVGLAEGSGSVWKVT